VPFDSTAWIKRADEVINLGDSATTVWQAKRLSVQLLY
jgi:hypothetical protein